jgi:hypothetical protein
MSNPACNPWGVNTERKHSQVTLEPELEAEACLMTSSQRREFARKLERWARQLRVSAVILDRVSAPKPPPSLTFVPRRRLLLN